MQPQTSALPPGAKVLSVTQVTRQVQQLLQDAFPSIWVAGEVSKPNRQPASGHVYLTLKDSRAQLPAMMWRDAARGLPFQLTHGLQVIAHGRLDVYAPQGKYQFIIDQLLPKGMGPLELAFQQLKEKLDKLGFFARERKRPLPRFPRRIVLVTSPVGAAVRDLAQIIKRRWPPAEVLLRPVKVQGPGAAEQIAAAIRLVNRLLGVDVLIVGRGGGSIEDLWAFNLEIVARAIFESRIPVISAVGHESDLTIADLVADRRAATPSEAAEIVVPDQNEIRQRLDVLRKRLERRLDDHLAGVRQRLEAVAGRRSLRYPLQWLREHAVGLAGRLERMQRGLRSILDGAGQRLQADAARLEALSPLNVLSRGYSLTRKEIGLVLLRSANDTGVGERIVTRLGQGELVSRVEEVRAERAS